MTEVKVKAEVLLKMLDLLCREGEVLGTGATGTSWKYKDHIYVYGQHPVCASLSNFTTKMKYYVPNEEGK